MKSPLELYNQADIRSQGSRWLRQTIIFGENSGALQLWVTYNRICCSLLQRSKSPAICHNSTLLLFQMCKVRNEARTFQHVHLHNEPLIKTNHDIRFDEMFSLFYYFVHKACSFLLYYFPNTLLQQKSDKITGHISYWKLLSSISKYFSG